MMELIPYFGNYPNALVKPRRSGGGAGARHIASSRPIRVVIRRYTSVYDAAYAAAADQANRRLVSCDDRALVSKALAIHPASVHAS
jgi:uncharacterized protein (UPF0262 family)